MEKELGEIKRKKAQTTTNNNSNNNNSPNDENQHETDIIAKDENLTETNNNVSA